MAALLGDPSVFEDDDLAGAKVGERAYRIGHQVLASQLADQCEPFVDGTWLCGRDFLPILQAHRVSARQYFGRTRRLRQSCSAALARAGLAARGIKYHGYIARQAAEVDKLEANESTRLPEGLDYTEVRGLGFEVSQKLNQHRPETLGQASRISGVTPAAISLLLVHLKKKGLGRMRAESGAPSGNSEEAA